MMKRTFLLILALLQMALGSLCFAADPNSTDMNSNADAMVLIETSQGPITVRLYGDTPAHRDNFLKLVNEGLYDALLCRPPAPPKSP